MLVESKKYWASVFSNEKSGLITLAVYIGSVCILASGITVGCIIAMFLQLIKYKYHLKS